MTKAICVHYKLQSNTASCSVRISYQIEKQGSHTKLFCMVTPLAGDLPAAWLQLKHFSIQAAKQDRAYALLYNDQNYQSNLDTSMFIDKACKDILEHEQYLLC